MSDYAEAWNGHGAELGGAGRNEKALEAFTKVTELRPDYAEAWCNKGLALINLHRLRDALNGEVDVTVGTTNTKGVMPWNEPGSRSTTYTPT
jgi:tetratricopeptide (TPR) repeat protein